MNNAVTYPSYIRTKIVPLITISEIITIHYFEFSSGFVGPLEAHNFWELVYVDKGEVIQTVEDREFTMQAGDYLTIQPNDAHQLRASQSTQPNVFIISFACSSKAMDDFRNRMGSLPKSLLHYISDIMTEARQTYKLMFNNPSMLELMAQESELIGGQQMIQTSLEQLYIQLYRALHVPPKPLSSDPLLAERTIQNQVVGRAFAYIQENVYNPISARTVCEHVGYSNTYMSTLFHRECRCGIAETINRVKIDEAKRLIRCSASSFAEIAVALGYTDQHYFSRVFRKIAGMSPSEYRRSLQL